MRSIKCTLVVLITATFSLSAAFAQNIASNTDIPNSKLSDFIQVLGGEKHRLNFTFDYHLTESSCASIYREGGFDAENNIFYGAFKDYRSDGVVVAEGFYKDGYLDNTLLIRYLNGNVWQKGAYKNNAMVGTWEYFFPDGKPMYTIHIKGDQVFLDSVWDIDGQVLVKNGEGNAVIYHYTSKSVKKEISYNWRGKVTKGLMQGVWMPFNKQEPIHIKQVYDNGRFINGYDEGKFYNTVNLFSIGQDQALINAEALAIATCDANPTNDSPSLYPLGEAQLKQDIYKGLDEMRRSFPRSCIVKVSFHVDANGKLSDFRGESETGVEKPLIEVMGNLGAWLPATEVYKPVAQRVTYAMYFVNKQIRKKGDYPDHNRNDLNEMSKDLNSREMQKEMQEIMGKPMQWKKIQ